MVYLLSLPNPGSFHGLQRRFKEIAAFGPTVTPLKYSHIPKASESWVDAFKDDPMIHYLQDTPDFKKGPLYDARHRYAIQGFFALNLHKSLSFTIEEGAAVVIGSSAPNASHKRPLDRLVDAIANRYLRILLTSDTKEQRKRGDETKAKYDATLKKAIGKRLAEMFYLGGLATEPASQGQGYGGALVDTFTAIADSQGCATWLASSNIANTEFYNSHGFITVGEFVLGDKNPTWNEPPVVIRIMVREPSAARCQNYDLNCLYECARSNVTLKTYG